MSFFSSKIKDSCSPVIVYELIPPASGLDAKAMEAYVECAAEIVSSTDIQVDAFNIPEIRNEHRDSNRTNPFEDKIDPRAFTVQLRKAIDNDMEIIINRCTVYDEWLAQEKWLADTLHTYAIRNLILVGGESSKIKYPGPSIMDMSEFIRKNYCDNFLCGGITIPRRRKKSPQLDEPQRLLEKSRCGLEFFTSQVLYDAEKTKSLLKDYYQLCEQFDVKPKRIFLSFAPASSKKDVEFLKWLGVEVSQSVQDRLLKADIGIGWRSVQVAAEILKDILDFVHANNINVPLGLNIEHITRRNFELTKQFIEELGAIYYAYMGVKK